MQFNFRLNVAGNFRDGANSLICIGKSKGVEFGGSVSYLLNCTVALSFFRSTF